MFVNFGKRLKEERTRLGYTQTALVEICEISYNAYSNYELGKRKPDAELLMKLGSLGFDIVYLLMGLKNAYAPKIRERALLKSFRELSEEKQIDVVQHVISLEMGKGTIEIIDLNQGDTNNQIFHRNVKEVTGIKK